MSEQGELWGDGDEQEVGYAEAPRELPEDGLCPHCGAKMREYKHHLNEGIVLALRRLLLAGRGPVHLHDLDLTYSQRCNFQKLRYFGLVDYGDENRRSGRWRITDAGARFVRGEAECYEWVWTWRGERVRWDGERIRLRDVVASYETREEWAAESAPRERSA